MTQRIVVVGGGISGLAAVHELVTSGHEDVVLLESSDQFGGKIRTSEFTGRLVDEGGDAFLTRVPWALELCAELGLDDQYVSPATRQAFIYSGSDLHPLPAPNVLGIPLDPDAPGSLLSDQGRAALREDMERIEADPIQPDDTVGSLVRRRLGDEIFERLVSPLLGSINAGDLDNLSLATAPQIARAAENPSLINGLVAMRSASDPDAPVFHSFPNGLGQLVETLTERYRNHLRSGASVVDIVKKRKSLRLDVANADQVTAGAVVLTTPGFVSGPLVGEWEDAAALYDQTEYVSVVLVSLAYKKDEVELLDPEGRFANGSGFLVPRTEGPIITACSWSSSKWEHLDNESQVLLRVSLGHAGADAVLSARDADILSTVKLDLAETMGIVADPQSVRITRWPRSFPQYDVDHPQRVADLRGILNPDQVFPAGAGLDGIGVPACIKSGRDAARAAMASVR